MSGSPFAANNAPSCPQPSGLLHEHPAWAWPEQAIDSRPLPGRHDAVQHLTLPPMHTQYDADSDIENTTTPHAPSAHLPNRSNFLAHILNGGDDEAATQPSPVASSSSQTPYILPPAHSPLWYYDPRMPSPQHHGYVDLTREQTPPISQERSTLRTLHHHHLSAEPPTNRDSSSFSPMPPHGRRKRQSTSPLFMPLGPSPKRAKRNDGSSGTTSDRRGSRQEGASSGSSNVVARNDTEEVEQIDLLDDNAPLAEALQRQRAEQVKAQQESPNGADAPPRLTSLTCVICMDTPKDLTATSCGHIFCHTCLMEALIAGEQRSGPGEPKRSQCPVCRKNLSRNKTSDIIPLLLMQKGLATQPRRQKAAAAPAPA